MNVKFRLVIATLYYIVIFIFGYIAHLKKGYFGDSIYAAIILLMVAAQTLVFLKSSWLYILYVEISPKYKAFSIVFVFFANILLFAAFCRFFL